MRCKQCGVLFDEGVFCPECGTRVEDETDNTRKINTFQDREKKHFPAIAGLISLLIVMAICKTIYGGWGTDKETGDNTRTENKTDETQIAVNEEQHTDNKEQDTKESQIENSDYKSYIEENNDILEEKEYSQSVEMELPTFLLVESDRIDEVKPGKTYLYYDGSEYVFANIVYDMEYSRITLHFIVEEDGELVKYKDVFYFDNSEDNPLEYGDDYGNRIVVKSEKSFMIILNGYDYSDEIYKLADDEDIAECQKHLETIVANTCEYILPESDSRYISYDDLRGLTADECRIARNELYARYGRKFDDEILQAHFNSCSWYKGTIEPKDFNESILNEYEEANRDLIVQYEKDMGYR